MPVRPVDERCFGGICCEVIHDCSSGAIPARVAGPTAATKEQVRNCCFFDVSTKRLVTSPFAAGRQCSRAPDQNFSLPFNSTGALSLKVFWPSSAEVAPGVVIRLWPVTTE
jgi:hypothetical protein